MSRAQVREWLKENLVVTHHEQDQTTSVLISERMKKLIQVSFLAKNVSRAVAGALGTLPFPVANNGGRMNGSHPENALFKGIRLLNDAEYTMKKASMVVLTASNAFFQSACDEMDENIDIDVEMVDSDAVVKIAGGSVGTKRKVVVAKLGKKDDRLAFAGVQALAKKMPCYDGVVEFDTCFSKVLKKGDLVIPATTQGNGYHTLDGYKNKQENEANWKELVAYSLYVEVLNNMSVHRVPIYSGPDDGDAKNLPKEKYFAGVVAGSMALRFPKVAGAILQVVGDDESEEAMVAPSASKMLGAFLNR